MNNMNVRHCTILVKKLFCLVLLVLPNFIRLGAPAKVLRAPNQSGSDKEVVPPSPIPLGKAFVIHISVEVPQQGNSLL